MPQQSAAKTLALAGVAAAVVLAATLVRVPVPTHRLYFNLGEAAIYTAALLWGPRVASLAGGVGSALADLLSGYPIWAPITLVIKSLEGYVAGRLTHGGPEPSKTWQALVPAATIMVAGYSLAAWLLYGKAAVLVEFPGDLLQVTLGGAVALTVARLVARAGGRVR
ncbi:MAG: ECF transporter S component [Firmicutes bacterium]|nr:ECF transporter S component [Bacillota bacterium]